MFSDNSSKSSNVAPHQSMKQGLLLGKAKNTSQIAEIFRQKNFSPVVTLVVFGWEGKAWVGPYLLPLLDLGEHHDCVAFPLPHHPPEILHRVGQGALGGDEIILLSISLREESGVTQGQGQGTGLVATGTARLKRGFSPRE